MAVTPLLQVVPRLPPSFDGVGAYAAALARALGDCGLPSRFLVTDHAAPPGDGGPGNLAEGDPAAAAVVLDAPRAGALARQLAASGAGTVLVHYVNYAYQRRGCPRWLVGGAVRWRRAAPGRRLVTVFHEVYATGPPWRSSFWLFPVQRGLAARLLAASDAAVTTLGLYGAILARLRRPAACPVLLAPVFSTVGEPDTVTAPAARRPRTLAVFGGAGTRGRAYAELAAQLAAACRALAIEQIVDVGPPLPQLPAQVAGVPVRALGALAAGDVGAVLARAYAGFVAYPSGLLAKSTVHAAYCAHGMVPVCAWPGSPGESAAAFDGAADGDGEGLNPGEPPFWNPAGGAAPADPDALAARARAWYHGHRLALQAGWYRDLVEGRPR